MKLTRSQRTDSFLEEIRNKLSAVKHRPGRATLRRYPEDLKILVRNAVAQGYSRVDICRATGLSSGLIGSWLSKEAKPKVRRLEVVETVVPVLKTTHSPPAFVIRFSSGTTIELSDLRVVVDAIICIYRRRSSDAASC